MKTHRTRVFLVDDHPISRHGLRQIIESDGHFEVVGEASDGQEALKEITRLKPEIAVLDIQLPKLSGLEVARRLQNARPPVALIFLTMHGEESTFNTAMNAGAQGYILKENAVHDVLLGLRAVAAGGVYLSPIIAGFLVRRNQRASALRQEKKGLASLTPTERQILRLVADNKTNKEIGDALCISPRTVEKHRANICGKLDLQGPHALGHFAVEHRSEL